jgi:two-component system, OmpR family, phosphate regulon response regulator PhoB
MPMQTILIVDDQPEVIRLLQLVLRGEGRRLLFAGDGQSALDLARQNRPDIILMDVMMPGGIDGLQATRILKGDPETAAARVIVITAKAQEEDRQEALAAGADDYVAKPFDIMALRAKVKGMLQ